MPTAPDVLPEGSVLLHIGPPKTGSTAIQRALHGSRAELAAHGVLYPGTRMRAQSAGAAVLGIGASVGRDEPRIERWEALVDEIRRSDLPRTCLSQEPFARADDAAVGRILDGLGTERTHVLYVARRLDKLVPSHWQERVKAWTDLSYEDFLHRVLEEPDGPPGRRLWGPQDVGTVVGRWAARVGHDRVTVLISDEHDRELIPRTFEAMLGLPAGMLVPPPGRSNTSLSFVEAEAIRELNRRAHQDGWSQREYWKVVQRGVVPALAHRDRSADARIEGLPAWALEQVAERAERQIAEIQHSGVRVVGDPEQLRIRGVVEPAPVPEPVEAIGLDLLADLVSGLRAGYEQLHAKRRPPVDVAAQRDNLGARQLVQLLARRLASRVGVRRS
ncbi:hypothetical protein ACVW00_000183 [Marmoricola sp. URHA0025 HA25]